MRRMENFQQLQACYIAVSFLDRALCKHPVKKKYTFDHAAAPLMTLNRMFEWSLFDWRWYKYNESWRILIWEKETSLLYCELIFGSFIVCLKFQRLVSPVWWKTRKIKKVVIVNLNHGMEIGSENCHDEFDLTTVFPIKHPSRNFRNYSRLSL